MIRTAYNQLGEVFWHRNGLRLSFPVMLFAAIATIGGPSPARAQSTSTDWAWKELLNFEGLEFSYLFYSKADNFNNGIVLKLTNRNGYAVRYRFKVVFRTDGDEVEIPVAGQIDSRSILTGEIAGLFFVPFPDGRNIAEVGLRGYRVEQFE